MTRLQSSGLRSSAMLLRGILLAGDLLVVAVSFLISYGVRFQLGQTLGLLDPLAPGLSFFLQFWPAAFIYPLMMLNEDLYPGLWYSSSEEVRRAVRATVMAGFAILTLTFITQTGIKFSRVIVVGWWALTIVLVPSARVGFKSLLGRLGFRGDQAVMIGAGITGTLILRSLSRQPLPVLDIVAVFDDEGAPEAGLVIDGLPLFGNVELAQEWAAARGIRTAVVAMTSLPRRELIDLLERLSAGFHRLVLVPDLIGLSTAETYARDLEGIHTVELRRNLLLRRNRWLKRGLELLLLTVGLVVYLPVAAGAYIALLVGSGQPVLFRHRRLGFELRPFYALKFQTMVHNADEVLAKHLAADEEAAREWDQKQKLAKDPRITPVGRLLRRLSLDELPQLWNVVKGEMSLVGPRPITEGEVAKYGEAINLYRRVKPGITGLWQTRGRSATDFFERVRLDAYYVRNWSIWLDIVILVRTLWAVFGGEGAY